jgi:hypothetical protein
VPQVTTAPQFVLAQPLPHLRRTYPPSIRCQGVLTTFSQRCSGFKLKSDSYHDLDSDHFPMPRFRVRRANGHVPFNNTQNFFRMRQN